MEYLRWTASVVFIASAMWILCANYAGAYTNFQNHRLGIDRNVTYVPILAPILVLLGFIMLPADAGIDPGNVAFLVALIDIGTGGIFYGAIYALYAAILAKVRT
jgi:hypothetical protein